MNVENPRTEDAARPAAEGPTVALACVATVLAMVMFTVPMSTLVTLGQAMGASATDRTWMLSAASIGLGAGLLVSGALADRLGRRTVFVIGAAVQAGFLFGGAVFASSTLFSIARVGQGLGAAALVATSLGLIAQVTPHGHRRTRATGFWGASLGVGILIGPLLAALLGPAAGWRSPYLVIGLLSLGLIVFARVLPANPARHAPAGGRIDYFGAAALIAGPSALLAGLVLGRAGWVRPTVIAFLVVGVLIMAAFVRHERRTEFPLVDISLFTDWQFVTVTVAAFTAGFGVISLTSYTPTLVEQGLHGSALAGSLPLVIWAGVSVLVSLVARHLRGRITPETQLALGLIITGAGLATLAPLYDTSTLLRLIPGFAIAGIGTGLLNAALGAQAVATVPAHHASMGSGVNNTARYLGSGLGVAVVTSTVDPASPQALLRSWTVPVVICAAISVLIGVAIPVYARISRSGAREVAAVR
ncbi:MFS transporter [Amycolatopsis rhabdoformis]|uniref:MFS transporter n=1 Tax=Amycolatopsis rhabdoformis TaxID=1448059 RepID=A0ABZ1IGG7_9PSEU|nr:MFS transporter [Amycolatopsis rhabdoformis]WSE32530.1 MFS transporter [Amycolatopsis rhabdoformis]